MQAASGTICEESYRGTDAGKATPSLSLSDVSGPLSVSIGSGVDSLTFTGFSKTTPALRVLDACLRVVGGCIVVGESVRPPGLSPTFLRRAAGVAMGRELKKLKN